MRCRSFKIGLRGVTSDYNFVRQGDRCIPAGPEPIPAGICKADNPQATYLGSSGYRRIPGNTCNRDSGVKKDEPVEKPCSAGEQIHTFQVSSSNLILTIP